MKRRQIKKIFSKAIANDLKKLDFLSDLMDNPKTIIKTELNKMLLASGKRGL